MITTHKRPNRGMTMVMALFVTFLLSTLSLAFVMLMMEDSRGSRSSAWQVMSAEGAEWGIETTLSYMGRGGNWQPAFDPERLVFFDLLNPAQPNGPQHLVAAAGGSGGIEIRVEAGTEDESATRTLRIVNPELPLGAVLDLDGRLLGRVTVVVKPVEVPLAAYGPGQAAQYSVTCLCELFRAYDAQDANPEPVAVSQLEALVRPEVETTALFQVQNMRSWDVQGAGVGNSNTADKIIIPSDYVSAGSVRVTGTDPNDASAPWSDQSGNLRFEDPDSENMVFQGQLSVAELSNLDQSGNSVAGTDPDNFPGGVVFGADFLPLPSMDRYLSSDGDSDGQVGNGGVPGPDDMADIGKEWGLLAVAAQDTSGPDTPYGEPVSGYYKVNKDLVARAHNLHPRLPDQGSGIPLARQDYSPAIPEVEVRLLEDGYIQVNSWETNHGDGGWNSSSGNLNSAMAQEVGSSAGPLGQTFHVDQLKNGVIYVEGGQVVVHSELSSGQAAEFEGRLQIIASEDPLRRGLVKTGNGAQSYPNAAESLYHPAVDEYLSWQEARMQLPTDDPDYIAPADFKAPPYTAATLKDAAQTGAVTTSVSDLATVPDDSNYWVPPNAGTEREGNLVVAGDILKKEHSNSMLGLTAENFILLNDRTIGQKSNDNELVVEAVLTSFEHSLQFDWDNTSNNRVMNGDSSTYDQARSTGFDGKFILKGSMLAPFSDVEGDLQGRGYPRQEFRHDSDLARQSPPFQPRTLLSEYPNDQVAIAWTIISFKDRTSRGVYLSEDG
jgi:hypothetical protein